MYGPAKTDGAPCEFVNEQNIGRIMCRNIANQADFCCELMIRLKIDVCQDVQREAQTGNGAYFKHMAHYTQREADIIRLRRELMNLAKML